MMNRGNLTIAALLGFLVLVPVAGILLCALITLIQIGLMGLRPAILQFPRPDLDTPAQPGADPIFSVHVATHAEPPALVIRTLRALLAQDWGQDRYEIIVMDNNTADPALWAPVAEFSSLYPGRIRFFHEMEVKGAKAGALNIALGHARADASHIVTVDADYVVTPDFLSRAAAALHRTGADYVQFPQAYTGTSALAAGVDAELEEYFRSNATVADGAEAVLLTGTLCVLSRRALEAAGGWSGVTTTEDAEMGVRLCQAGFTGRFIDQVVGQGLLPLSLRDLEKQRDRWCGGNLQTLIHHMRAIFLPGSGLSLHKRLVLVSQLTAWFNLTLLPTLLLLAEILRGRGDSNVALLASMTLVLGLVDVTTRVVGRGLRDRLEVSVILRALICRIALAPQAAKATAVAMLGREMRFVVTSKRGPGQTLPVPVTQLVLFAASVLSLLWLDNPEPLVVAALAILALPLPAALFTDMSLRAYGSAVSTQFNEALA